MPLRRKLDSHSQSRLFTIFWIKLILSACQSNCQPHLSHLTFWQLHCLAVLILVPEGACQEGLCHWIQLGDHFHLHVCFLLLLTVFLLSYSRICTSFYFCSTNSWPQTCVSLDWVLEVWRAPGIYKYESQNQVQVQGVGSSVLPGGPAVHVVELSDGGKFPPGEVVDPDGHFRSSQGF